MKKMILSGFILSVLLALNFNVKTVGAEDRFKRDRDMRVNYFYEPLKPYGEWFVHNKYGLCWYPYNVSVDWRPYTDGHWVLTEDGWTWVSDLPWGWAGFHYGRWFFDETYGWCWYPDTVWAPSWVIWRTGDDWIGWAPLPPEAIWDADAGFISVDFNIDNFIPRHAFCFVRTDEFINEDLGHHIRMPARNENIIRHTEADIKNLRIRDKRITNELPVQGELEKKIGHTIEPLKLVGVKSPSKIVVSEKEVMLFRPELSEKNAVTSVTKEEGKNLTPSQVFVPSNSPELINRHKSEMHALEQNQAERKKTLAEEQNRELQNPPQGQTKEQLQQQHKQEMSVFQEQTERERNLLNQWHSHEIGTVTPKAPPRQHYNISTSQQNTEDQKTDQRQQK